MARIPTKTILEQAENAWRNKQPWDDLIAECYEYAMPDRNPYFANGTGRPDNANSTKGQRKNSRKVTDSTLMTDAMRLVNRIQSELFPIGGEWANMVPGPFIEEQTRDRARSELRQLQKVLFLSIQLSNFDLSISEWLIDLVVAGTACMLTQEGNDQHPIVFQCVPQSHVALREGAFGFVDGVFRKHRLRASLVPQQWPDAKKVKLKQTNSSDDDDPEISISEVTYLDAVEKVWRYEVIVEASEALENSNKAQVIAKREYVRSPWSIGRWSKAPGEVQGRSIVMQAMPDARTLSAIKKYLLQQAALSIGGVFMVRNDGVINANSVRIFPGATIPVRSTGGGNSGASVAPLQVGGDVNLAQLVIQDLVTSIHKVMMNNGPVESRPGDQTATEFLERLRDMQQSLGAPFARILKEAIVPILEGALQVLGNMKVIPMPESGAIRLNGGEVSVTFNSPLVQQQSLREVEALVNASQVTRQIAGAQAGEQAVQVAFKVEGVGKFVGEKMGVVPNMMRTAEDAKKLMEQAGQMAAQGADVTGMAGNGNAPGGPPQVGQTTGVMPQQMAA